MTNNNPYENKYRADGYYWGKEPSDTARKLLDLLRPAANHRLRLIDLGCGEGRNAVYFARHGFRVTGLDLSPTGLRKANDLAVEAGVSITTAEADICTWAPEPGSFDILFSTGTLHYLPPDARDAAYGRYKAATAAGGAHAVTVFVEKPFVDRAPDADSHSYLYRSGELLGYYWDWEILFSIEEIFDCRSGGIPHRHAVNRVIARRR